MGFVTIWDFSTIELSRFIVTVYKTNVKIVLFEDIFLYTLLSKLALFRQHNTLLLHLLLLHFKTGLEKHVSQKLVVLNNQFLDFQDIFIKIKGGRSLNGILRVSGFLDFQMAKLHKFDQKGLTFTKLNKPYLWRHAKITNLWEYFLGYPCKVEPTCFKIQAI